MLRLKGTNYEKARAMIKDKEEQLGIYFNDDFDKAAQLVVKLAAEK